MAKTWSVAKPVSNVLEYCDVLWARPQLVLQEKSKRKNFINLVLVDLNFNEKEQFGCKCFFAYKLTKGRSWSIALKSGFN